MTTLKIEDHRNTAELGNGPAVEQNGNLPQAYSLEVAQSRAKIISTGLRKAARQSRVPVAILSGGGGFKARRGERMFIRGVIISFILMVLVPFLAVSIYLPFFSSDQFASEARFAVRGKKSSPLDSVIGMAAPGASQQLQDSQIIANFLRSRAAVDELENRFDLRQIFGARSFDYLFRFAAEDPKERLVRYWERQVTVSLDRSSGITSIEVRAFRAEDALAICSALLEISERMVNDLTERAKRSALSQAEDELRRSEARLETAMATLKNVRDTEGVLDADAMAASINEVTSRLRLSLAKTEQEIDAMRGQLSPTAPQIRYLTAQAAALRSKIAEQEKKVATTGAGGASTLSASASLLDRQKIEVKIAQELYASSIAGYEKSRAELETQGSFLITFLKPQLAEEAEYPKRWLLWSIVVFPATIIWLVLLGIAILIRDYMAS